MKTALGLSFALLVLVLVPRALQASEPRLDDSDFSCIIIPANVSATFTMEDPFGTLTINGIDYTGADALDTGLYQFQDTFYIGMYKMEAPLLTIQINPNDGSLAGTFTGSDTPPTTLRMGCTVNNPRK